MFHCYVSLPECSWVISKLSPPTCRISSGSRWGTVIADEGTVQTWRLKKLEWLIRTGVSRWSLKEVDEKEGIFCKMALNMPNNSRVFLNYCITFGWISMKWVIFQGFYVICQKKHIDMETSWTTDKKLTSWILQVENLCDTARFAVLTSETSPRFKTKCTDMHHLELHWSFDYWFWLIKCWPWKTQNAICTYMTMVQKSCMDNIHIIHMKWDILSRILKQ